MAHSWLTANVFCRFKLFKLRCWKSSVFLFTHQSTHLLWLLYFCWACSKLLHKKNYYFSSESFTRYGTVAGSCSLSDPIRDLAVTAFFKPPPVPHRHSMVKGCVLLGPCTSRDPLSASPRQPGNKLKNCRWELFRRIWEFLDSSILWSGSSSNNITSCWKRESCSKSTQMAVRKTRDLHGCGKYKKIYICHNVRYKFTYKNTLI